MLGAVETPPTSKLSWSPARQPGRTAIEGDLVRLEVLDPKRHATSLFSSSHAPGAEDLWQHLPYGPFAGEAEFIAWLEQRSESGDPLFYAVVDRSRCALWAWPASCGSSPTTG